MDSLNFIFGLRAVNTTNNEEKPLSKDDGTCISNQESVQKDASFNEKDLKEENFPYPSLKDQEIHEVIF